MINAYDHDDDLIALTREDGLGHLKIYRPRFRAVVLGRGSKKELEIHKDTCEEDSVLLFRRRGGGCSVYIDSNNIVVSLSAPAKGFGRIGYYFNSISKWLISGLAASGVPDVTKEGICDLSLHNKKIGGACLYRERDLLLYSTTLVVEPDYDKMERYLKHPPREPEYRGHRSHRDFVGSICNTLSISSLDLEERLKRNLLTPPDFYSSAGNTSRLLLEEHAYTAQPSLYSQHSG
jgi:lipoate-protein ligase A